MHALAQWSLAGIIVSSAVGALIICYLVIRYGLPPSAEGGYTSPAELNRRLVATRLGHDAAGVCFAVSVLLAVVAMVVQPRAAARAERPAAPDPGLVRLETDVRTLEQRLIRAESRLDAAESRANQNETPGGKVEHPRSPMEPSRGPATATGRRQRAEIGRPAPTSRRPASVVTPDKNAVAPVPRDSGPPSATPVVLPRDSVAAPPPTSVSRDGIAAPSAAVAPDSVAPARPAPRGRAPVPSAPPAPRKEAVTDASQPASAQGPAARTLDGDEAAQPPSSEAHSHGTGLKTKLQDDWRLIKRDARGAGDDIRKAFRRFRDWLAD